MSSAKWRPFCLGLNVLSWDLVRLILETWRYLQGITVVVDFEAFPALTVILCRQDNRSGPTPKRHFQWNVDELFTDSEAMAAVDIGTMLSRQGTLQGEQIFGAFWVVSDVDLWKFQEQSLKRKLQKYIKHINYYLVSVVMFSKDFTKISMLKSVIRNKDLQTWILVGWQHSCQPIRSLVKKSLLTTMILFFCFVISILTHCGLLMSYGEWHRTWLTLVHVMACCLAASSHYMK